jgi:TonB family protein
MSYWFFVEVALKSTAVLGAAWLAARCLRGKSAALRHLLWTVAFAALLILPYLSAALPALRVPVSGSLLAPGPLFQSNAQPLAQSPRRTTMTAPPPELEPRQLDWRMLLMLVWAAGTAVSFAQILIGCAALERLRRKSHPFALPGFASMTNLLEISSVVDLLEAAPGSMPAAYGLFRPAILMPADASEWSEERRDVVLLHELAHVRRRDGATHLVARAALSLHWWNPLAWAAWRAFLKEQEQAADDLVLSLGACASEYASHLLEIARAMQSPVALRWAAVAMARPSQLEGRLLAILDSTRNRKAPRRAFAIAASLAAVAIIVPLAALQAKNSEARPDMASAKIVDQTNLGSVPASLIEAGDAERERGKFDEAKALYGQALAAQGSGPESARALIRLGVIELAAKNFEQAIGDFKRAQSADSKTTGQASMWMAITNERQHNPAAAEALYQTALAAEEPNSPAAATIMELYSELLEHQDRHDEASAMRKQAVAARTAQTTQALSMRQPSSPGVHQIGGAVSAPVLLSKVEPEYSQEARIAKYSGSALLSIEVGVDGVAHDIRVVRPLGFDLDRKAIEAVRQWRFKPGVKDGQPVATAAQVQINFRLL